MTEREMLMKKIATLDFAVYDLHLYLDTHPGDATAIRKMQEYTMQSNELKQKYEMNYATISAENAFSAENRKSWITSPWPWDGGIQ